MFMLFYCNGKFIYDVMVFVMKKWFMFIGEILWFGSVIVLVLIIYEKKMDNLICNCVVFLLEEFERCIVVNGKIFYFMFLYCDYCGKLSVWYYMFLVESCFGI